MFPVVWLRGVVACLGGCWWFGGFGGVGFSVAGGFGSFRMTVGECCLAVWLLYTGRGATVGLLC